MMLAYNPSPPVEFGARGIDVDVAWEGGGSIVATGNSFAAPHVTGLVTLLHLAAAGAAGVALRYAAGPGRATPTSAVAG